MPSRDHGLASRRVARGVPAGTTVAELAGRSVAGWPRRPWRRASTEPASTCPAPLADGDEVRIVTADSDAGRSVLRHSTAHVLAQAVLRLVARRHATPSGRSSRRLLLRLRAARRGPLHRRGPRAHRCRDAGDHGRGPALRPPRAHDRRGPRDLRRPALQAEIIEGVAEAATGSMRSWRPRPGGARARSVPTGTARALWTFAGARTYRPPIAWGISSSPGLPVRTGAATRTASSCKGSTGRRGSPRPPSRPTCTASRRPNGATTGSLGAELDLFSFPRARIGPRRIPPKRRHLSAR